MWPQVPDIKSLSASEARAFAREIRLAAAAALRAGLDDEGRVEYDAQMAVREALLTHAADLAAAEALESDTSDDEPEAPAADPEPEVEPAAEEELSTKPVPTSFGAPAVVTATPAPVATLPVVRTAPEYLFAVNGVNGKQPGDPFESWAEVSAAAAKRSASLNPATSERFEIARIKANYGPDRILGDDVMLNAVKFEQDSELMAAFCPPATPYYNIGCANTLRRPVFNSLPGFQAPRGRVSIMPSPSLEDITGGYGQWTSDDDVNPAAEKDACQTITCGSPTEYEMYGVYRCLTVKNMMAMTYPELVEAYLNRLGAAQARFAEELMLNAMATSATDVQAPGLGYGGSVSITSTILNYLALYQETQRWDLPNGMHAWMPRWVLWAMKMDILRRRRVDTGFSVPSDAQIEGMFRDVGVNVTWFIDRPTWAVAVNPIHTANTLNPLPTSVDILLAPPGKFAAIDRGELAIGVTGNNIYRDNESNKRNQFTFFFENFEGVVDASCEPAHLLNVPACWNGVQIDDIVLTCDGLDEVGYQS
jgi:hypothetical protein